MKLSQLFSLLLLIFLLSGGVLNSQYRPNTVLSWNMGSSYCRPGQSLPNCDSYILTSVNKLITLGKKYDIICLQEFPKYYRSQQKAVADKLIDEFVIKYKYSVFRKEGTDIAILSRLPINEFGELDLSQGNGAQRIKISDGIKSVQVVNMQGAEAWVVPSLDTRKEDIRKILRWMSQPSNKADLNILAGDFGTKYTDFEPVINDVNPFGVGVIPARYCPGPYDCMYVWGQTGWPFSYLKMADEDHQYAVVYTKFFQIMRYLIPNSAGYLTRNTLEKLAVNGTVYGNSYQNAFIPATNNLPGTHNKFILEQLQDTIRISCPYDSVSYLVGQLKEQRIEYQNESQTPCSGYPLIWASWKYLQESSTLDKNLPFYLANDVIIYNMRTNSSFLIGQNSGAFAGQCLTNHELRFQDYNDPSSTP